jgi:hypothetical protein
MNLVFVCYLFKIKISCKKNTADGMSENQTAMNKNWWL